jgi:hypothetical protein
MQKHYQKVFKNEKASSYGAQAIFGRKVSKWIFIINFIVA